MEISIIIVNWNTKDLLLNCISSVYETVKGISFEIWLVDNCSADGSVEAVQKRYPAVKTIQNSKNLGFAAANNRALAKMNGRYALLLNTDTVLKKKAVEILFKFMEKNPEAGMACGQLLNRDGSRQNSIANFPDILSLLFNETVLRILLPEKYPSKMKKYNHPVEVDSCIGACLMVRKSAMDQVGIFDENYFFFFEETDWAYRMKQAGWKNYFLPFAEIFHLQGQSVGHDIKSRFLFYRSRYIYFKKWHPKDYTMIRLIIFSRIIVNAGLNLAGVAVTFGLQKDLKKRLDIYVGLIRWHLQGCPEL